VTVTLDPKLTLVSNLAGTITESVYDGKLRLNPGTVTIGGTQTTTALVSSANPSGVGNSVTFTATVSPAAAGKVVFRDGGNVLGTVTLSNSAAAFTTAALSAGSHGITAFYEGDATTQGSTSAVLQQVVQAPPPAPPASLTATATSTTTVLLTWPAVANAASYEISRSFNGGPYTVAGTSTDPTFTDNGRTPNVTYLYQVRAVATGGAKTAPSPTDAATMIIFTDDPLAVGTKIKKVHIQQLRAAVNAYRRAAGMGEATFTDADPTRVRRLHFEELRIYLQAARNVFGLPPLTLTDPSLAGVKIKAVHQTELRAAVK
jgi:hypothetical protein